MSVREEHVTPSEIIARQYRELQRRDAVIQTLKGDQIAHLLIGAVVGGGLVLFARWQADPLIRLLDDLCTALGWTAAGR